MNNDKTPSTSTGQRDMTSSETAPDKAPRKEGLLDSIGRAIGETVTVPSGPDTIDKTPTETRDTPKRG